MYINRTGPSDTAGYSTPSTRSVATVLSPLRHPTNMPQSKIPPITPMTRNIMIPFFQALLKSAPRHRPHPSPPPQLPPHPHRTHTHQPHNQKQLPQRRPRVHQNLLPRRLRTLLPPTLHKPHHHPKYHQRGEKPDQQLLNHLVRHPLPFPLASTTRYKARGIRSRALPLPSIPPHPHPIPTFPATPPAPSGKLLSAAADTRR